MNLKNLYILFRKTIQYLLWNIQILRFKKVFPKETKKSLNTLVISPHADDELIGCYAYIKKHNPTVFLCSLTGSNNSIDNKLIRENEFEKFCLDNNLPFYIARENLEKELKGQILNIKPDRILVPSMVDWHFEHRLINEILSNILKDLEINPEIFWYQVSVPITHQKINATTEINKKLFKEKWDSFYKYYPSQKNINVDRFKFLEKHTVLKTAAESYFAMDTKTWMQNVEILKPYEEKMNDLKSDINNLKNIKLLANEFYKKVK